MVLVDGVKYSCQGCITGHRTSKCTHTDRPLLEIRKKGRPVSQCTNCRDLRKTRSIHGRCDCAARKTLDKPAAKVLANGLVDLVKVPSPEPEASSTSVEAGKGLRVSQLLNPCNCRRGGKCSCTLTKSEALPSTDPFIAESSTPSAAPVKSCCSSKSKPTPSPIELPPVLVKPASGGGGCCSSRKSTSASPSPTLNSGPLFLPSTHGTASCFCGESCACVGCPQHDPLGRKQASLSTASAAMACRCDDNKEQGVGVGSRPCCGGSMGQLQKARVAGMGELELAVEGAREEGRVRLPPMVWDRASVGMRDDRGMTGGRLLPSLSLWGAEGLERREGNAVAEDEVEQLPVPTLSSTRHSRPSKRRASSSPPPSLRPSPSLSTPSALSPTPDLSLIISPPTPPPPIDHLSPDMFALPDITLEELDAAMDDEAGGGYGGECGCTSTSGCGCACGGAEEAQQGHWSSPRRRPSSSSTSFEVDLATCLPPPFLTGSASAASASSSTSRRCYSGAGGTPELTFDELRPEDIEGFGSGDGGDGGGGGGGGGVWESGGGVMDDEARVMAELIAAGFC